MSRTPRAPGQAPVEEADSRPSYPLTDSEVATKEGELRAALQDHEARQTELDEAESEAAQLKEQIADTDLGQQLAEKKDEIKDTKEILASVSETIRRLAWETSNRATREEQTSLLGGGDTKPAKAPKAPASERTGDLALGDEAPAHDPALVRETAVGGALIEVIMQLTPGSSYPALDLQSDINDMLAGRGEPAVTSEEMTRALRAALDSGRLAKGPSSRGKASYVRPVRGKAGKAAPASDPAPASTVSFTGEALDKLKTAIGKVKVKHGVTGVTLTAGGKTVSL